MTRALLWLVAGFMVFILAVVATAPELLGAQDNQLAGLAGVAIVAGIPGLVIVIVLAAKRHDPDPDDDPGGAPR